MKEKKVALVTGGSGGIGTEICKNLALGNTKTIYLYDLEKVINYKDLETGYYYKEEDIGFLRSEILKKKINELNPHIILHSCNSYKENQNVTIVINQNVEYILEINKYCRHNNSKLIVLFSGGLSGVIFLLENLCLWLGAIPCTYHHVCTYRTSNMHKRYPRCLLRAALRG